MSRKLIFVKGLLLCFDGRLFSSHVPWSDLASQPGAEESILQLGIRELIDLPALDALCRSAELLREVELLKSLLTQYDRFLEVLNDKQDREHLAKNVAFDDAGEDDVFNKVRQIGRAFGESLEQLFFENNQLKQLTKRYGVF